MGLTNPQFKAVWGIHQFFLKENIPYAVIGGVALQMWGEPRFTRDVDVTIMVNADDDEEEILKKVLSVFQPRINDALEFALKNRVCLVKNKDGCEIDISLGVPGYEDRVIKRAVHCEISKGRNVKVCSPEDLIIHKAIAGRPQDISDIESIVYRQGKKLDARYIRKWLREFSSLLEMQEVFERFEKPWGKFINES